MNGNDLTDALKADAAKAAKAATSAVGYTQGRATITGRTPSVRGSQISGFFPEEVAWQLRQLVVNRRTTVQVLVAEALNELFTKHGMPPIA
jgi:hypothetical protein